MHAIAVEIAILQPTAMKNITTLIAIIALSIASATANAAITGYLLVKGQKQGQFVGAKESKSFRIPVISFDETVHGIGSGKKATSNAFKVTIGSADLPEFSNAANSGEILTNVQLELVKPDKTGKVVLYCTITLTNATVSSVQVKSNGSKITQEITFNYQRIVTSYPNTTQGIDDWKTQTF